MNVNSFHYDIKHMMVQDDTGISLSKASQKRLSKIMIQLRFPKSRVEILNKNRKLKFPFVSFIEYQDNTELPAELLHKV